SLLRSHFAHAPAPTEIYTLSLHDALPICSLVSMADFVESGEKQAYLLDAMRRHLPDHHRPGSYADLEVVHYRPDASKPAAALPRSEEHTSELQSRENLVCRLLLEKKNDTR